MKNSTFLVLLPLLVGALSTSSWGQTSAAPAGNTASPAGLSGGPGLGDTPSTAPAGTSTGSVPVQKAVPVSGATGSGSTSVEGSGSTGVVHATGAGISSASSGSSTTTAPAAPTAPTPAASK